MSQAQPPDDRPTEPPAQPAQPTPSGNKVAAFFRMMGQLLAIVFAALPLAFNLLRRLAQLLFKGLKALQSWWVVILPKLRTGLPEPWKTKLPNQVLTAIALLFVLSFLSITFALLPGKPPALVEAPYVPSSGSPNGLPSDSSPAKPAQTADFNRLIKIQDQLAEIAMPYSEGLVESVRATRHNRLKVTLSNAWYALEPDQQDKLANEVLKRSQKLKFNQLELTNAEGVLLARSPVVGSGVLMLERTLE
ncbi:MAG: hypothetical protein HY785_01475 [Oscillatoriophycideae cyanobacterium NC_groundwater_1537_Pr4_S-0.65um_50_18]|nr:hypothetical protein [Oscillatoriophycideae cyanobacterium NC_groundwater_1537_Pr4_S-0.65um_50_18]